MKKYKKSFKNDTPRTRTRIYFIGGINGVGKSKLLDLLAQQNQDFEIIHGSEYFMQWLGLEKGDYRSLRSLPHGVKNEELNKMMRSLTCCFSTSIRPRLISAHYLGIDEGKITCATGNWISLFDALFFINAKPEEILERINRDFLETQRNRPIFPVGPLSKKTKLMLLSRYLKKSLEEVKKLSVRSKVPYFVIQNKTGTLQQTVDDLINRIKLIEK